MHDSTSLSVSANGEKIFNILLLFYPEQYRKRYGHEMLLLFRDMYKEEFTRKDRISLSFWVTQVGDITKSAIEQHIDMIQKQGIKKYLQKTLHINVFNIVGSLFLLPAFIVFCIDLISRIAQGDLVHYNRPVYSFLSHTPLYWYPVLFTWVILFPFLTVLINVFPLVRNIIKNQGNIKNRKFIIQNIITIALLSFAAFFILLVKFHDFGPCMLHGIARYGFERFTHIVTVCKNA